MFVNVFVYTPGYHIIIDYIYFTYINNLLPSIYIYIVITHYNSQNDTPPIQVKFADNLNDKQQKKNYFQQQSIPISVVSVPSY